MSNSTPQKFKDYIQLLLGFVLGSLVFLPSIVGLVKPPPVLSWAIPWTLVLLAISVILLGVALLMVMLRDANAPPYRLVGLGSWCGFIALLLLFGYVTSNVFKGLHAAPVIVAVKLSPVAVEPEKYVELDVDASDQGGDPLTYQWVAGGAQVSTLRNAYIKAPKALGLYPVTIRVSNGRRSVETTVKIDVVAEHSALSCPTKQDISGPPGEPSHDRYPNTQLSGKAGRGNSAH